MSKLSHAVVLETERDQTKRPNKALMERVATTRDLHALMQEEQALRRLTGCKSEVTSRQLSIP